MPARSPAQSESPPSSRSSPTRVKTRRTRVGRRSPQNSSRICSRNRAATTLWCVSHLPTTWRERSGAHLSYHFSLAFIRQWTCTRHKSKASLMFPSTSELVVISSVFSRFADGTLSRSVREFSIRSFLHRHQLSPFPSCCPSSTLNHQPFFTFGIISIYPTLS